MWTDLTKDWSPDEIQLFKESWRQSTLDTYKAPLKRWINWCEKNKVDPGKPSASNLARFLANLYITEKLAFNTILLHKSAISTFCSGGKSSDVVSDFLVRQVLKSISNQKPKDTNKVIWDAKLLFDWLAIAPEKETLFEISRRCAAVLLLASGRRIHDLTLLKISENYFQNSKNEIILWPVFGSKTDRSSFRQSGWKLCKHSNKWLCPVTLIKKLISISQERRKDSNSDFLFISVTGIPKVATKTIIAGWIRSVLKEAKIDASPGSIRSAVASRSWLDDIPLQEILDHGNWKCVETFRKHYYKDIQNKSKNVSSLLSKNFSCV